MLNKLWIKSFRNISEINLDLSQSKYFLIFGSNNQGKTNFLEALYFMSNGKTLAPSTPNNILVKDGHDMAYLGLDIDVEDDKERFYFKISNNGDKKGFLKDKPVKSWLDFRRRLNIDYMSADVIQLFQGPPDGRRKEIDWFCSIYFKEFSPVLKKYERIIKQKNKYLKQDVDASYFEILNQQILENSKIIMDFRLKAMVLIEEKLSELSKEFNHDDIVDLRIKYHIFSKEESLFLNEVKNTYEEWLKFKLSTSLITEKRVGYSVYGPHRDDYFLEISGKKLNFYFSRGINRVMSVLFKLVELILIYESFGTFPIVLLDDTFAELDFEVKKSLISIFKQRCFVFYTSVVDEDKKLFKDGKIITVTNGNLKYAETF